MALGCRLITNGTDNHLMLVDTVTSVGLPGNQAEKTLDEIGITLNKNMIANDTRSPMDPSGVRMGTPAMTTRGMKEPEMEMIANWIVKAWKNHDKQEVLTEMKKEVTQTCLKFPVPGSKITGRAYSPSRCRSW